MILPTGKTPGESIVRRAYNEGKQRLEELSEINPRNFTEEGQSPYRYHDTVVAEDDQSRLENAAGSGTAQPERRRRRRKERPHSAADADVATAKQYEGLDPNRKIPQVDIAMSSVLSPGAGQQQYLQQARGHYEREPLTQPQVAVSHHSAPQHSGQRTQHQQHRQGVDISMSSVLSPAAGQQQYLQQAREHYQPEPVAQPQVAVSMQGPPQRTSGQQRQRQRPLKLVNYQFDEQYGSPQQSKQQAVVSPQKAGAFIPSTKTVTSVAAELDLKHIDQGMEQGGQAVIAGHARISHHQQAEVTHVKFDESHLHVEPIEQKIHDDGNKMHVHENEPQQQKAPPAVTQIVPTASVQMHTSTQSSTAVVSSPQMAIVKRPDMAVVQKPEMPVLEKPQTVVENKSDAVTTSANIDAADGLAVSKSSVQEITQVEIVNKDSQQSSQDIETQNSSTKTASEGVNVTAVEEMSSKIVAQATELAVAEASKTVIAAQNETITTSSQNESSAVEIEEKMDVKAQAAPKEKASKAVEQISSNIGLETVKSAPVEQTSTVAEDDFTVVQQVQQSEPRTETKEATPPEVVEETISKEQKVVSANATTKTEKVSTEVTEIAVSESVAVKEETVSEESKTENTASVAVSSSNNEVATTETEATVAAPPKEEIASETVTVTASEDVSVPSNEESSSETINVSTSEVVEHVLVTEEAGNSVQEETISFSIGGDASQEAEESHSFSVDVSSDANEAGDESEVVSFSISTDADIETTAEEVTLSNDNTEDNANAETDVTFSIGKEKANTNTDQKDEKPKPVGIQKKLPGKLESRFLGANEESRAKPVRVVDSQGGVAARLAKLGKK